MASLAEKIKDFYARHGKWVKALLYLVWAVLFAFLGYTVWKSREQLMPYLVNADRSQFVIVVGVYLLALFFAVMNWAVIIRAFDSSVSFWTHAKIYLVSMVSRRLPGTIWYVGSRMLLYEQLGVASVKTASASGIEFVVSFVADCLLAVIFIPLGFNLPNTWLIPLGVVTLLGLWVLQPKVLSKIMIKLKHPLAQPVRMGQVIVWLLLRMALVLTGGVMIFFTIRIFYPMSFQSIYFVLGARALSGAAGMLTFLLPSSMGASDITLLAMLSVVIPTGLAAVVALLVRIYTTLFELLFGLVFFIALNRSLPFTKKRNQEIVEPENLLQGEPEAEPVDRAG